MAKSSVKIEDRKPIHKVGDGAWFLMKTAKGFEFRLFVIKSIKKDGVEEVRKGVARQIYRYSLESKDKKQITTTDPSVFTMSKYRCLKTCLVNKLFAVGPEDRLLSMIFRDDRCYRAEVEVDQLIHFASEFLKEHPAEEEWADLLESIKEDEKYKEKYHFVPLSSSKKEGKKSKKNQRGSKK